MTLSPNLFMLMIDFSVFDSDYYFFLCVETNPEWDSMWTHGIVLGSCLAHDILGQI